MKERVTLKNPKKNREKERERKRQVDVSRRKYSTLEATKPYLVSAENETRSAEKLAASTQRERKSWRFLSNCGVSFAREAHFRYLFLSLSLFFFSLSRSALIGWMRVAATSASFRLANRRICRVTELPDSATTDAIDETEPKKRIEIQSIMFRRRGSIQSEDTLAGLCCFLPFRRSNWMTSCLEASATSSNSFNQDDVF